jgi:hypothetical protein
MVAIATETQARALAKAIPGDRDIAGAEAANRLPKKVRTIVPTLGAARELAKVLPAQRAGVVQGDCQRWKTADCDGHQAATTQLLVLKWCEPCPKKCLQLETPETAACVLVKAAVLQRLQGKFGH